MQRCLQQLVDDVDGAPALHQLVHCITMPLQCRKVQRCPLVTVAQCHIGACFQQQLDALGVASQCRQHEGTVCLLGEAVGLSMCMCMGDPASTGVPYISNVVHSSISSQQVFYNACIANSTGLMQWRLLLLCCRTNDKCHIVVTHPLPVTVAVQTDTRTHTSCALPYCTLLAMFT